nr:T9SS type A sorting domain-containing protein [Flavisolibacter sp.]
MAKSQSCSIVNNSVCDVITESFESNPTPRGFSYSGFEFAGPQTSGRSLRVGSATSTTDYLVTSPAYYFQNGGSTRIGFTIATGPIGGSNNYFEQGGLNFTLQILSASDVVITSCTYYIPAAGTYCMQIVDAAIMSGTNYKYRFIFVTTENITGSRWISFDNLSLSSSQQAVLPVTFVSITGKNTTSGNMINWTVAGEVNVAKYEIEKSSNGKSFSKNGEVIAGGVTGYTYTDVNPGTATNYYRIKSVDVDGKTKLSPTIAIKTARGGKGKIALAAFPSPAISEVTIQHDAITSTGVLSITAGDGRLVKNIIPARGSMQTIISMAGFTPGLYIIRFQNEEGETETIKIVKQ